MIWQTCLFICIICGVTDSKKDGSFCYDWKHNKVPNGETFQPDGKDPCMSCLCHDGEKLMCAAVSCYPRCRTNNFKQIEGKCCEFVCFDDSSSAKGNLSKPNINPRKTTNRETLLVLPFVVSAVTSLVAVAILAFAIHHFRRRRLFFIRERFLASRNDYCDGGVIRDSSPYPHIVDPRDNSPYPHITDPRDNSPYPRITVPQYIELPPPYVPAKPLAVFELPPPYTQLLTSSTLNADVTIDTNSNETDSNNTDSQNTDSNNTDSQNTDQIHDGNAGRGSLQ